VTLAKEVTMRELRQSFTLVLVLAVVAMGCSGGSPTAPPLVADASDQVSAEKKGGIGGGNKDTGDFTVTFDGAVFGSGGPVGSSSSKVVIGSFVIHINDFLAGLDGPDYPDFGKCFGDDNQDHGGELSIQADRKDSTKLTIKVSQFSGERTDGVTPLDYKLSMTATIKGGSGTWPIANAGPDVVADLTSWDVTGYRKSVSCQGEGDFPGGAATVTVSRGL
jgi:hypothetical protein